MWGISTIGQQKRLKTVRNPGITLTKQQQQLLITERNKRNERKIG